MTKQEIAAQLRSYLVDSFMDESAQATFRDHDDLFKILDSLQVLRMVVQLEKMFDIRVEDSELTAENLGSVEKVAAFLARKRRETIGAAEEPANFSVAS